MHTQQYDIFISYRREDGKDIARMLKESLERKGYRVFLDLDELQDGIFDKRILDAIQHSRVYILLMTSRCFNRCVNANDWVRQEIEYALSTGMPIIPINPDKQFIGFPDTLSQDLKQQLGSHQYSAIDTGQLYQASIDQLDQKRLRPLFRSTTKKLGIILTSFFALCLIIIISFLTWNKWLPNYYLSKGDSFLSDTIKLYTQEAHQAINYYRKAIRHGDARGYTRIGNIYDKNSILILNPNWNTNSDTAFYYYQLGARAGDGEAQYHVAILYDYVFGPEQNPDSAFYWATQAYISGYPEAAGTLGHMYEMGIGTSKDLHKALDLYEEGALAGCDYAQSQFGNMLRQGDATPRDFVRGSYWLVQAALQDNIVANWRLGKLKTWVFSPKVDSITEPLVTIKAISWATDDTMRIYCEWHNKHYSWMQIDRGAYVEDVLSHKRYMVSNLFNCKFSPDTTHVNFGKRHYFALMFAGVPDTIKNINFCESDTSHWKFYNIHIENKTQIPSLLGEKEISTLLVGKSNK